METLKIAIISALLSVLPISEVRGAIPLAFYNELRWFIIVLVLLNILTIPLIFLFLDNINTLLLKIKPYKRFFEKTVERTRRKIHKKIEKYGYLGLMLFVAIPLPFTGAYTGTLAAWFFKMNRKKSFIAIALGVIIASIIVSLVCFLGLKTLSIFTKTI